MTIRLRLTLYWAAVLAVILILSGAAVLLLFAREQWGQLDSALLEEADTASATIQQNDGATAATIVRALSAERDLGPARRVRLTCGTQVLADSGDARADLPAAPSPARRQIVNGRHRVYRFAAMPLRLAGRPALLLDGVDARPIRASIARLRRNLLVALPLILALSVAGGSWLARRALEPINALAAGLGRIEPRDLQSRLARAAVEDEVARLTDAINSLLARVARATEAERRFAADAAHELRTPLAVLRAGLEVALAHPRPAAEYADALAASLRETVALCRMADELLTLARLDHDGALARSPLNLCTLLQEVIDAVEPLLEAKQLELRSALGTALIVNGNADYLRRLIVNLLDNALKFAPPGGWVAIALTSHDGVATLRFADSGPGIAAADLPRIFDRFFRGTSTTQPGNGLGLSLCREIARLHAGEIRVANLAGGGAEFVVTLPLAAAMRA
ncbi:MAG TPA: ATP-binding protein [Candidatus Binataceae bacterium]|nr:ATP-binding protein [Candidatus Binataceae bacterium]